MGLEDWVAALSILAIIPLTGKIGEKVREILGGFRFVTFAPLLLLTAYAFHRDFLMLLPLLAVLGLFLAASNYLVSRREIKQSLLED